MGPLHHDPAVARTIARDTLPGGVVVSTVRLPGPDAGFESMAFSRGWPETGDVLATTPTRYLANALAAHRALVERFAPLGSALDPSEPGWVYRMMDLPPRRFPRGRA